MATIIQLDRKQWPKSPESPLTPELKAFIDRLVVPLLVQKYVDETKVKKAIAESEPSVASCMPMRETTDSEVAR